MNSPVSLNTVGFAVIVIGILLLIWSLYRKAVSVLGVVLLIVGFVIQIIAAFLE